jgi:Helix-turn-helix domain
MSRELVQLSRPPYPEAGNPIVTSFPPERRVTTNNYSISRSNSVPVLLELPTPFMNTQSQQILAALKAGESITPMDALERWGCFRLGARIFDLSHGVYDGVKYDIQTIWEKRNGKRYARYRIRVTPPPMPPAFPQQPVETTNQQQLF